MSDDDEDFTSGDYVLTPLGRGTVQYCIMAPPDYRRARSYCVRLDARTGQCGYNGTMFQAGDIGPTSYVQ